MTPHEERKIALWNRELTGKIRLKLHSTLDPRSRVLQLFCTELSQSAPKVHLSEENAADASMPFIEMGGNLRYSGVPLGLELAPFLQALALSRDGAAVISPELRGKLARIDRPVHVRLYVAQRCPTCPAMARSVVLLPRSNPLIHLHIIDAALFPEAAQSDAVQGVPTVILEGGFRWTGTTRIEEIVEVLISRDVGGLSASAVERMLEEGNASKVAQMVVVSGTIPSGFIDLLTEERFTVRLGAMAAMEEIVQRDPSLAATIARPLWERFERVTEPVQIDILYLLGETGSRDTIPVLESVLSGHHRAHVKEVAGESIARIRDRTGNIG